MRLLGYSVLNLILVISGWSQENVARGSSRPGPLDILYRRPSVELKATFIEASGNRVLDGGEQGTLVIEVSNRGQGKAYDLNFALIPQTSSPHVTGTAASKTIPLLKPGDVQNLRFPLTADLGLPSGRLRLRLTTTEKYGSSPAPVDIDVQTRAFLPPKLVVSDIGVNDAQGPYVFGNGNSKIEKGETVEVHAILQNRGQGEANNVSVELFPHHPKIFFLGRRRFNLGDLKPNAYQTIRFTFTIQTDYDGPRQLPITLQVWEVHGKFGSKTPLGVRLNQTAMLSADRAVTSIVITGTPHNTIEISNVPSYTVDVDVNIPETKTSNKTAVAVIIGNSTYDSKYVPTVDYALRDASVMREYVIKSLGFREENVIFELNATKATFDRIFGTKSDFHGQLHNYTRGRNSDIFVYYSGHGAPDIENKQSYLVPRDCYPQYVRLSGYSINILARNLSRLESKSITLVIDACFSGISEKGSLLGNISPIIPIIKNPLMRIQNGIVFTAASGGQVSHWYTEMRHGLFTYFFLKGLQGQADGDNDRRITAEEMSKFLQDHVPYLARRMGSEQVPQMLGRKRDMVLLRF